MNIFRFKCEEQDRFFPSAQRSLIVDKILKRMAYGDGKTKHAKVSYCIVSIIHLLNFLKFFGSYLMYYHGISLDRNRNSFGKWSLLSMLPSP